MFFLLSGCHYEVLGDTGYIRSPKFDSPKDYPRHSSCSWLITVDDVDLVVFNFSFLNIRDDDVIEVYDGHDENTSLLAFHSRLNISKNDSAFLSSSNSVFIILKYGTSSNSQTEFVCEYGSQPKPTLQVISTSVPRKKNTQEPNRETADQSGSSQTTNIVVAVVVGVVIVLILIAILIFIRRYDIILIAIKFITSSLTKGLCSKTRTLFASFR